MSKTITIDDEVYRSLSELKRDRRDSFTEVIRRMLSSKFETAGEILDAWERMPSPKINLERLEKIAAGRGRRSGGRK